MSLRAFHIFFILASVALSFIFGAWSVRMQQSTAVSAGAFVLGAGLVIYLGWFLRKVSK